MPNRSRKDDSDLKNAASSDLFLDFSVEIIIIARLWLEKSGCDGPNDLRKEHDQTLTNADEPADGTMAGQEDYPK